MRSTCKLCLKPLRLIDHKIYSKMEIFGLKKKKKGILISPLIQFYTTGSGSGTGSAKQSVSVIVGGSASGSVTSPISESPCFR